MDPFKAADFVFIFATTTSLAAYAQGTEPHGWLNTETLKTRSCNLNLRMATPLATRPNDCLIFKNSIERSKFI